MNDVPRNDEPSDDIDELYHRAAAQDPSRPSERVRDAVLSHAAQLAAERPSTSTQDTAATAPTAAAPTAPYLRATPRRSWYKASRFVPRRLSTIVGTVAAAVLVGLLVTPRFLLTRDATHAAAARVRVQPAKEAQMDLNAASKHAQETAAAPSPAAPAAAPAPAATPPTAVAPAPAAAPPPASAPAPSVAYASAASSAVAQARSLTFPAAPDSPVSGAALRRAAELGDLPKLQALFDRGVDVNARDADERSALLLAVLNGRNDVVKLLLAHNANVNAADRNGTTPLQAAESTHQPAIAATLRAAGAH